MTDPTKAQIERARAICARHDPNKAYQYIDGSRDDYPMVEAVLAAITETQEWAAKLIDDSLFQSKNLAVTIALADRDEELAAAIRNGNPS